MFKIEDGRLSFWQWDLNQRLIVEDASVTEVHFCHKIGNCSLVCEVYEEDGKRLVNVPNILLQDNWTIRVYAYCVNYTKIEEKINVFSRSKPADYIYTETEIKNYDDLAERINQIENNGVSDERIGEAVSDYLTENPVSVDLSGYATEDYVIERIDYYCHDFATRDELEGAIDNIPTPDLSNYATIKYVNDAISNIEIPEGSVNVDLTNYATKEYVDDAIANVEVVGGSGLTNAQISALDNMFKVCAFIKSDVSEEYNTFKVAFGITDSGDNGGSEEPEPDIPVEPDEPTITLVSISATYTGGSVAVGTNVNSLTGITVKATYSDGSIKNVTDYTLSGTIGEGNNTIVVSYGGKTTTFIVVGVDESGGDTAAVVNLFDKNTMVVSGAFIGANGAISTSATSKYAKIPISLGTYALQKGSGWGMSTTGHPSLINGEGKVICSFGNLKANGASGTSSNSSIGTVKKANGNNGIAVTVLSEEVKYIIFSICVNGGADDTDSTMMEMGDTCNDYVAFKEG